jgi:hypothetical protein
MHDWISVKTKTMGTSFFTLQYADISLPLG